MTQIPHDRSLDSTLALLRDGYTFISKRCEQYQTDIFQTRFLLQKTICMRGEDAAKVFYNTNHFKREGAALKLVQKTLLGEKGVQTLDDDAHRHRKQMFMSLMAPHRIQQLADHVAEQWRHALTVWEMADQVVFFDEVSEILCRAVCAWSDVPLPEAEVEQRTADIMAMIDGAGGIGLRHWQARRARARAEEWVGALIEQVRARQIAARDESALHVVAWHRELNGELLDKQVAAVELLNVLRPVVAVGRFITFAALALHEHPECRQKLQSGDGEYVEFFVQEVRRYYPFFPMVPARVRHTFDYRGYRFPEGVRVLLDLYGTNRDSKLWEQPERFRPERFRTWDENAYNLIPQGGGDYHRNHRCPGEWITIELMKVAADFLVNSMTYDIPKQDLEIPLSRMPTLPESRFIIRNVQRVSAAVAEHEKGV